LEHQELLDSLAERHHQEQQDQMALQVHLDLKVFKDDRVHQGLLDLLVLKDQLVCRVPKALPELQDPLDL
jgi:hypothetical protein